MSASENFLTLLMDGRAHPDDIDEFVERWHENVSDDDLPNFLGMTADEYRLWFHDPDAITTIAHARRFSKNLTDAVNDNLKGVRLAARTSDLQKISRLQQWLDEVDKK